MSEWVYRLRTACFFSVVFGMAVWGTGEFILSMMEKNKEKPTQPSLLTPPEAP